MKRVEEATRLAVAAYTPDESSSGDLQPVVSSGAARQGEAGAETPGREKRVVHLNDVSGNLRKDVSEELHDGIVLTLLQPPAARITRAGSLDLVGLLAALLSGDNICLVILSSLLLLQLLKKACAAPLSSWR